LEDKRLPKLKTKKSSCFFPKILPALNESLRTINDNNPQNLLLVLNDRIPDGTDVSWIWDIDFETLININTKIYLAGDRVYDLALRLKYAGINAFKRKRFLKI